MRACAPESPTWTKKNAKLVGDFFGLPISPPIFCWLGILMNFRVSGWCQVCWCWCLGVFLVVDGWLVVWSCMVSGVVGVLLGCLGWCGVHFVQQ